MASHKETVKDAIIEEFKGARDEVGKTIVDADNFEKLLQDFNGEAVVGKLNPRGGDREDKTFVDAGKLEKLLLLQDVNDKAIISPLKPGGGTIDADKWEKLLQEVNAEAFTGKAKPGRGGEEATEDANTGSLSRENSDGTDASRRIMMLPSSSQQWACVPILRNLGTIVTVGLAVIATMFLTELLLCISLSTGPVIVVVRGIVALVSSAVRRVSTFVQATKQVAVDVFCCLAEMFSERKLLVVIVFVVTTTAPLCLLSAPPIVD